MDLARLVGRHQTVIGPYERDEYEPPRDVIEKLARVLDTSPEYLYFGRSPQRSAVPVAGRVGMLGLLEPQGDGPEELLMLRDDQLLAFPDRRRQHGARVPARPDRAGRHGRGRGLGAGRA